MLCPVFSCCFNKVLDLISVPSLMVLNVILHSIRNEERMLILVSTKLNLKSRSLLFVGCVILYGIDFVHCDDGA